MEGEGAGLEAERVEDDEGELPVRGIEAALTEGGESTAAAASRACGGGNGG